MEVSRLEKRLTKLTQLLANPPPEPNPNSGGLLWSISGARNQRKQLEQSIVTWEDDASVLRCPFCQQEFSTYTFRRHHCRLCGRVVCGDPITDCSQEIGLNVVTGISGWLLIDDLTELANRYVFQREGYGWSERGCSNVQGLPEHGFWSPGFCGYTYPEAARCQSV